MELGRDAGASLFLLMVVISDVSMTGARCI